MSTPISRRALISSMSALSGLLIGGCNRARFLPPSYGSVIGLSDALTMSAQRLLLARQPLAREYTESDITAHFPTVGTVDPDDPDYVRSRENGFRSWRTPVSGLVDRPLSLSLEDIKRLPARTQITAHSCERGWTAIAQWKGIQLSQVLRLARTRRDARYVVFECVDGWYESLDMFDALHPQTILAYEMNGGHLPIRHGAPVRLRVERQLGYKSVKYVSRIRLVDSLATVHGGRGSTAADYGYSWYAGI